MTIYSQAYQIMRQMLKEYRLKHTKSQEHVGELMKVDQSRVSKYESGELRIDVIQLQMFCKAIGVPLVDFIIELESRLKKRHLD